LAVLRIRGRRPLAGVTRAGWRKNSAVAVLPAALLADGPVRVDNLPHIADVAVMARLLRGTGAVLRPDGPRALVIDPSGVAPRPPDPALAGRLRASYYLLGVLLARFGEAEVPMPGGCDIGSRPIDQHLKGLAALGAEVDVAHGRIRARARRLRGAHIYLDVTSVGATINLMLAASRAEGVTVIENAAREPHVADVASLLLAMGGAVVGAGTDVIKVRGRPSLHGCEHAIIPDEIEAATLMIAAAGTGGEVTVENVIPRHLEPVTAKLREAGVEVREEGEAVHVRGPRRCRAIHVKTLPYPGFPTDAQQPMTALLATAEGTSTVTETIWDGRFRFVDELVRMGARIRVEGRTALIEGVPVLYGAPVRATDLRGAAALVLAGLFAEGVTEVDAGDYLDRGYERLEAKLGELGAEVVRIGQPEPLPDPWSDGLEAAVPARPGGRGRGRRRG
jgi:UDP-N-acetylglucosamine 1-carboxyvinyltransferase